MPRRLFWIPCALLVAIFACNTPQASAPATIESQPQVVVVTATPPAATSAPPAQSTANDVVLPPTLTSLPAALAPRFSHTITFAETPDAAQATRTFHQGTTRIYALWSYSNMTNGLIVHRDWYLNGTLWITRAVPWDFAKYGANGTVTDISIYDVQNGLPSGHYELKLTIGDQPQFTASDDPALRSFEIAAGQGGGN